MSLQEKRETLERYRSNGTDPAFIEKLEEEIKNLEAMEEHPTQGDTPMWLDECAG